MLTNTSEKLIISLQEEYGGGIYINPRIYPYAKKQQHQWRVNNAKESLHILLNILPYLRYKDKEARLAIEFLEEVAKGRNYKEPCLTINEINRRNDLAQKIRSLEGRRKPKSRPEVMEQRITNRARTISSRNKSGFIGVFKYGNKWQASIKRGTTRKHLGYFTTIDEAVAARRRAELELSKSLMENP